MTAKNILFSYKGIVPNQFEVVSKCKYGAMLHRGMESCIDRLANVTQLKFIE
jgi:hypothetical protein